MSSRRLESKVEKLGKFSGKLLAFDLRYFANTSMISILPMAKSKIMSRPKTGCHQKKTRYLYMV